MVSVGRQFKNFCLDTWARNTSAVERAAMLSMLCELRAKMDGPELRNPIDAHATAVSLEINERTRF